MTLLTRTIGPTPFTSSLTFMFTTSTVRVFFGNQYLRQSKKASLKSLWFREYLRHFCQKLWLCDYAGVNEAIRGFDWSQDVQGLVASFSELYTREMFQLLFSAYSTISIKDTALFLGTIEDDATNYVLQQGWTVDPASQMLIVKKQPVVTAQNLDHSKLQGLTEYVFHHKHRSF
ncbi:COP9 signalosome complex subunit 8-like [Vigna umbellata]|uniref:COP9 signalosome complex subunit 8-like n=1 Tax=Vigna umbellata TaxID=87088 RepID=UPI001F5F7E37|nr:COP9 signalosome complex subunit 8-like [Vigna umbellata]